jgi:hypothetical protein
MAWVMILNRSRALDLLRRERTASRAERLSRDEDMPDGATHTLDLLVKVDRSCTLHGAFNTLDDEQRQLLALAYLRGYSHGALASLTGLPLGTVKAKLRRALAVLRERLADVGASGGSSSARTVTRIATRWMGTSGSMPRSARRCVPWAPPERAAGLRARVLDRIRLEGGAQAMDFKTIRSEEDCGSGSGCFTRPSRSSPHFTGACIKQRSPENI